MKQYVKPIEIRKARLKAGLTVEKAAGIVSRSPRTWTYWEAGARNMHVDLFDIFKLRLKERGLDSKL